MCFAQEIKFPTRLVSFSKINNLGKLDMLVILVWIDYDVVIM
jgi:hypothetical protein